MPWRWIRTGRWMGRPRGDSFAVLAENGLLPQETAIPAANRAGPSEPQVSIPISRSVCDAGPFALPGTTGSGMRRPYSFAGPSTSTPLRHSALLVWISLSRHDRPSRGALAEAELAVSLDPLSVIAQEGRWLRFDGVAPLRRRQSNNTGCCWSSSRPSTKRGRSKVRASVCANGDYAGPSRNVRKGLQLGGTIVEGRLELQQQPVLFDCLLVAARHHQNEATAFLGDDRQWIERDSKFCLGQCLLETAGHGEIVKSIPEVRCGVTGVEVDGPAKEYGRLIPLPVVPGAQRPSVAYASARLGSRLVARSAARFAAG